LKLYAFISYQTEDKQIAGRIKSLLETIGVKSFLAHEDIDVSEEWRIKILEEWQHTPRIYISYPIKENRSRTNWIGRYHPKFRKNQYRRSNGFFNKAYW
jgi:hypothetical protein